MTLPAISMDFVVMTALLSGGLIGLFGGRGRLRSVILSVYVGIVLAEQLANPIQPYLFGWNVTQAAWVLLCLPILAFGLFGGRWRGPGKSHQRRESAVLNMIVGVFTGALVLTAGMMLMPTGDRNVLTGGSLLALELELGHLWLLGLMPLAALVLDFIGRREK